MNLFNLPFVDLIYQVSVINGDIKSKFETILNQINSEEASLFFKELYSKDNAYFNNATGPTNILRTRGLRFSDRKIKNLLYILTGETYFGTSYFKYDYNFLAEINNFLVRNQCYIYIVRGNTDSKEFFDNPPKYSNIVFLPDFSLIILKKNLTILTLGGGWAYDEEYFEKNNQPLLNDICKINKEIIDYIKNDNIKVIDFIISVNSFNKKFLNKTAYDYWNIAKNDKLSMKIQNEYAVYQELLDVLSQNNINFFMWVSNNGHYNEDIIGQNLYIQNENFLNLTSKKNEYVSRFINDKSNKKTSSIFNDSSFSDFITNYVRSRH